MLSFRTAALATATVLFAAAGLARVDARSPIGQAGSSAQVPAPRPGGWTIPPTAASEKNPQPANDATVAAGKELFSKNCQRCHGPQGKGDGPDADPDFQPDMDLTVAQRASRNPDGVIYYKVLNGRTRPKMPAFKDSLTPDQIWQIVTYVQTLRAKQ